MAGKRTGPTVAGIADHYGWAAVVTVGPGGVVVDRRRAQLVDPALPASPIHHEAQALPIDQAIALVHEVARSIAGHVAALWDELAAEHPVTAVALKQLPVLPEELADQIRSYHAQTRADPARYRRLLAEGASGRGWAVEWYDHRRVVDEATAALGLGPGHVEAPRARLGAPWTADHRRAYAAALLAQHHLARA